ncbi:hypothetical protein ACFC09_10050 [Streptomyces sp. NPDC056161]|uniref:hypothetical protein n=1 Tax=Streptomyces sp. NPDC056161 TaxID=3345732 RepID=UPI0035DF4EC1
MATGFREVTDVAPWLRFTLRLARLLLVLAAVLVPCGTATAYEPEAAPSDSAAPSSAAAPSPAGSRPGEARPQPDHPDGPAARTEGKEDADRTEGKEDTDRTNDADGTDEEIGEGEGEGDDDTSPQRTGPRTPQEDDDGDGLVDPTGSESPQAAGQVPSATPSADAANPDLDRDDQETATGPAMRLLPLGSGLVLIGLGLGLAFLGLRVRRG